MTSRSEPPKADLAGLPQRVSTLELFFDLVFVFTITRLTGILYVLLTAVVAGALAVERRTRHATVEA